MVRTFAQQKAALTRALRAPEDKRRARVIRETVRVIEEWNSPAWGARYGVRPGAWPDDWARWERALWDVGVTTPMEELTEDEEV